MTDQRKKEIAGHYVEAMNREDLHTSQAGRFLNLNPCYLSMVKNQKHWPSMSQAAWDRLEEWHESRCKISEFIIPEGEGIFKKPERRPSLPEEGEAPPNYSTGSAAAAKVIKKKGRKKSVKKEPQSSFAEDRSTEPDIIDRVKALEKKVTDLLKEIEGYNEDVRSNKYGMEIHTGQIKNLREYIDAVNEELLKKIEMKTKGEDLRKVIFFQRNYYKP